MRAKEFYFEASIFTKPEMYSYGHKVKVAGSKNGLILQKAIASQVPDFDASEELEWVRSGDSSSTVIQVGKGTDTRYFKRPNGEIFGITGSDKAIQSGLNHAKGQKGSTAENKGDLSEPILSAAVVAKLIKRGADNVEDITSDDLKNVLMAAVNSKQQEYTVNDKNSKIADTVRFTLAIRGPALEFLKTEEFWQKAAGLVNSSVHYANSGQIDKYADYFYKNGKVDSVAITSDGMSEQRSRKTDIEAYVRDENGVVRPLKNLSISLKAGSTQIGQVGGGLTKDPFKTSEKGGQGVWVNADRLFGPLGVQVPKPTAPVTSRSQFWTDAYTEVGNQLKKMLSGADAKKEAGVVEKISSMITYHGTLNDPNVKLVSLSPKTGSSTVVSFKGLADKLKSENINLDAEVTIGRSKVKGDPRPRLRIFDKNSNRGLISIRFSSTESEDKSWNALEVEELLKELTTIPVRKQQPLVTPTPNKTNLGPNKTVYPKEQPTVQQPVNAV
jgi:hypothetical protein